MSKMPDVIWVECDHLIHLAKHMYASEVPYFSAEKVREMIVKVIKDSYSDGFYDGDGGLPYDHTDNFDEYINQEFPELKGVSNG